MVVDLIKVVLEGGGGGGKYIYFNLKKQESSHSFERLWTLVQSVPPRKIFEIDSLKPELILDDPKILESVLKIKLQRNE